jgi:transmembrane sensor
MEGRGAGQDGALPVVTPEIAAEAAVWVARLHGPDRSLHMERECLAWQGRSAAHRLAFERCTDTWQEVAGIDLSTYARAAAGATKGVYAGQMQGRAGGRRPMRWVALALLAGISVGAIVLQPWSMGEIYSTGVGEQRLVVLSDGSRMSLNTATRVRVILGREQRTVKVEGGEALFEVAKDVQRPFVVRAAGAEVLATGTAFVVRVTPDSKTAGDALAVTLVEGQVVLRGPEGGAAGAVLAAPVTMAPGERVQLGGSVRVVPLQVDRPRMEQLLAWKRGEAIFDDASLPEAVAEMNRYSSMPIRLASTGGLGGLRVSGSFRTGDSVGFVRAVAVLHGLVVRELPDGLELAVK